MADGEDRGQQTGHHDTVWFVALQAHEVLDNERFQTLREDIKDIKATLNKVGWGVLAGIAGTLLNLLSSHIHLG